MEGYTLENWKVTVVGRTLKHGFQRIGGRVESINFDLLDPASWDIVDLDGDSRDDYPSSLKLRRAVPGAGKRSAGNATTITLHRRRSSRGGPTNRTRA